MSEDKVIVKQPEVKSAETIKPVTPLEVTDQEPNLTDEQWEIAFKNPRFKTLNERATKAEKELEKLTKLSVEESEKKLIDEKKWQELAEKKSTELTTLQGKMIVANKHRAVIEEAIKLGIKDTDAAVKLIDIDSITLDDSGLPLNATDVVKALAEAKPYLITGEPNKNIGANVNPTNTEGQKIVWSLSNLRAKMRDHDWYTKHKEDVDSAYKEGRVDYNK